MIGYLIEFMLTVVIGVVIGNVIWYLILRPILNLPYKQWDRKMKNPPPPPKRSQQWVLAKHHGLYQPDNKVDTSNPPKDIKVL